jgi:hypothetical protein
MQGYRNRPPRQGFLPYPAGLRGRSILPLGHAALSADTVLKACSMFDEDWMMRGLKGIPHHQGDGLTRKVGHIYGRGREYSSRRCPMTLQQLGSIAP